MKKKMRMRMQSKTHPQLVIFFRLPDTRLTLRPMASFHEFRALRPYFGIHLGSPAHLEANASSAQPGMGAPIHWLYSVRTVLC